MSEEAEFRAVEIAFEETSLVIPIGQILPLREVNERTRRSIKFAQIAASIEEVGIIEPPVVSRDSSDDTVFHLLDGHMRIAILRDRGETEVVCLVAKDDEAFTYNKRINRIATIQEHKMILNAIKKGVSEKRLARALNVNIGNIRTKRNLLVGICPEVAALLRDKHVPINVFTELRHLKPMRQIEAAELMIAMNQYSLSYAKSLVAATPDDQLAKTRKPRPKGLSEDQIARMQQESQNLDREFRLIEKRYGEDHLDLVLAVGYVGRLLSEAGVVGHLARHYPEILSEFQKVAESNPAT